MKSVLIRCLFFLVPLGAAAQEFDPLTLELGKPFPRKAIIPLKPEPDPLPQLGSFRVPATANSPFADFKVQVNKRTGITVAVLAKRAVSSIEDCWRLFDALLPTIQSKFKFRPTARTPKIIDQEDETFSVQLNCQVPEGGPYPVLSLHIRHKPELDSAIAPLNQRSGR